MIKPLAYLKEWEVDGEKRCRVDLHSDCEPWLRAYGPRITSLYARSDALEPGAVAESVASQVWAALDDLYALVRKQDMEPAFRGRIERALSVARWAPRGAEPAAREASKILTEYCPKCSAQMSNWSGKLTKCVKCLHEWYMDSTAAKSSVQHE